MHDIKKKLNEEEIIKITDIHLKALPSGILPQLGKAFLIKFYKYINESRYEELSLISEENEILGVCILSFESKTLMKRIISSLFVSLSVNFIFNFLRNDLFRKYVVSILIKKSKFIPQDPEIAYIFINPLFQGQGVGSKLLESLEAELIKKNIGQYYVKTLDDSCNAAIEFYKKNNFIVQDKFEYAGNSYLYFVKTLKEKD